jgi:hypothetical protein
VPAAKIHRVSKAYVCWQERAEERAGRRPYLPTIPPRSELEERSSHRARHSQRLEWVMWRVRHPASLHTKTAARLRRTAAVASWQQRRRGCVERWGPVVAGCRPFSCTLRLGGAYPVCRHGPSAFLLRYSRHVTTVRASGRSRAARQPSDDACSTHCQIPAWVSCSPLRVSAALRPIAGPAHSCRHRKPASVDGPSFVPARPIPVSRRVYGVPDP